MNCSVFLGIETDNEHCKKEISAFVFGLVSGLLAWGQQIPQIIKGIRTKSLDDYSKKTLILTGICHAFMIIYGTLIEQVPILINAPIALCMVIILAILKCIYYNKQHIDDSNKNTNTIHGTDIV